MLEIGIAIALGVIAVALIVIVVLLVILLVKKKPAPAPISTSAPVTGQDAEPQMGKTTFAGEYTIQLSDMRHPGQKWKLSVMDKIIIGRDADCTLVLTDLRVSRHHCEISVGQNGLLVSNLSETNETKQNGLRVSKNAPLCAGDILKLGHDELRVDFIKSVDGFDSYESTARNAPDRYTQHPSSNDTLHFFRR